MKILQYLLEALVIIIFLIAITTQLVLPAIRGTRLFPFFRREHEIVKAIIAEVTAEREQELEGELEFRRRARKMSATNAWSSPEPMPTPPPDPAESQHTEPPQTGEKK